MRNWKLSIGILAAAIALSPGSVSAAADSHILLNYKETLLGSSQVVMGGTTLVPLQQLAQTMGYALSWNQSTKTAKLVRPGREVTVTAGVINSTIDGKASALTNAPRILKGKIYVPLVSAVSAMGGKTVYDKSSDSLNIVDELRYSVASAQGRLYWVSQKNGDVFYSASSAGKPVLIGELPFADLPYTHALEIKSVGKGIDLLLLTDNHYAMFNDFSNGYQALIQGGRILKQMDYHYSGTSYVKAPLLKTSQLYMTDGGNIQYINSDGSLGKLFDLESITGTEGNFSVEYAAEDMILVRLMTNTHLYAIHTVSGLSTNLSEALISTEDRKEWDQADGSDSFILSKMLVLKKREGNVMTFTYATLPDGKVKTVTYNVTSQ
ncbi:copper amine oxidase N-terminal domain-containing protein [Paenibacillus tianjinensis]|uniref:Copper amine oxidase N-terminal domain-containing protein n=1 Tax=Paenibacillus tianjinensis TaxID=2810347 RepID=A0ABX7LB03_9BACL|nr:copper amine oxidase N-terminal domain-containing protein [Paenibacillus tianjinensis]QSF44553.1 copper amine oxidase N-terminal domain-containing protein [Paenibacillus tianjinensis]